MQYREFRYRLDARQTTAVEERLLAEGYTAFAMHTVMDGWELVLYHLDEHPAPLAALVELGLFPDTVADRSAEELWRQTNQAVTAEELAPRIWLAVEGADAPADAELVIRIPVGGGFGDGRHATTRLAATLLAGLDLQGRHLLDLGCGSGVLGILAWYRGARVAFSDIDAFAIDHTRRACALNGLTDAPLWRSDLLAGIPHDTHVDLVVANLYGDFLLPLFADPRLAVMTGHLLLSGISDRRLATVTAALADHGWRERQRLGADGWWALEATGTAARPALALPSTIT